MNETMRRLTGLAALGILGACATTPEIPAGVLERYQGSSGPASMTLDALRPLPRSPHSGWLNSVTESAADARFAARRRAPFRYAFEPDFVAFKAEAEGDHPPGKYYWRDRTLVICMRTLTPTAGQDNKLLFNVDYGTCAAMNPVSNSPASEG